MKIGIIVDGDGESQALRNLTNGVRINGVQLIKPVYADIQPKASPEQIAKKSLGRVNFLRGKNADKIILLIDREDSGKCVAEIRTLLEDAFKEIDCVDVSVVVKDRKFENWLISDLEAIRKIPGRFTLSQAFEDRVTSNKADNVKDAEKLLNEIIVAKSREFHKTVDACAITAKQDILRVSCNSRSFRRLLRLLNHPSYTNQSKKPHNDCKTR